MKKAIFMSSIIFSMFSVVFAGSALRQINVNESVFARHFPRSEMSDFVTGLISDGKCLFKHNEAMESDEACIRHCLANGSKIVLVEPEKKQVYALDAEGQKLALKFAGKRVKVSGHVMGSMIHVENVEAAE